MISQCFHQLFLPEENNSKSVNRIIHAQVSSASWLALHLSLAKQKARKAAVKAAQRQARAPQHPPPPGGGGGDYTQSYAHYGKPGSDLKAVNEASKKSAKGLDNWHTDEWAILSELACDWLAMMLDAIEDGAPWPEGARHGRAARLARH